MPSRTERHGVVLLAGAGSDPHAEAFGRWAAEDAPALWALLHDPIRQLNLRRALQDAAPELAGKTAHREAARG